MKGASGGTDQGDWRIVSGEQRFDFSEGEVGNVSVPSELGPLLIVIDLSQGESQECFTEDG